MSLSTPTFARQTVLTVAALGAAALVAFWAWPETPASTRQAPAAGAGSPTTGQVAPRAFHPTRAGSNEATSPPDRPTEAQDVVQGPRLELWVRAPVAGVLTSDADWPRVGETVDDGVEVGAITHRPAAARREQAGASGSVSEARAAVKAETAALADAIISHRRLAALRREANATSDAAVDEAGEAVERARSRLAAARTELARLSEQPPSVDAPQAPTAIIVDRGGTVVEVAAHPGETVGAGAPLLRLDLNGR